MKEGRDFGIAIDSESNSLSVIQKSQISNAIRKD